MSAGLIIGLLSAFAAGLAMGLFAVRIAGGLGYVVKKIEHDPDSVWVIHTEYKSGSDELKRFTVFLNKVLRDYGVEYIKVIVLSRGKTLTQHSAAELKYMGLKKIR